MTFDLNLIAFSLVGILFTGYVVLDGFDLGVGALHLFVKSDRERRILLNAIGPVWDGNEVWLVTGGGALFATFPEVYATVFSGFYTAFVFLLFGLIFRAVAIEFRGKKPGKLWTKIWDTSFCVSSILSSLILGVTLGNIVRGIPLDTNREFAGNFLVLLNPYSILLGVTTIALFMMHGSIYVVMKTDGELQEKIRKWMWSLVISFIVLYILTSVVTLYTIPHMTENILKNPILLIIPLLNILALANIPREIKHKRDFRAFISSTVAIICLMILFGIGMYPHMVYSQPILENSLTIYNAASSQATLKNILIIAIIGFPLVLSYTASIYWIFRGKVKIEAESY